jgi:hypothetical protein
MRVPNQNRRKNMSFMISEISPDKMSEISLRNIQVRRNSTQKQISKIG